MVVINLAVMAMVDLGDLTAYPVLLAEPLEELHRLVALVEQQDMQFTD
jgi:hypothetical protein